jgi:hypothetical protein
MTVLKFLSTSMVKFGKGIFLFYVILITTTFIVQSCKKSEVVIKDNAAQKYLSVVKKQSIAVSAIIVKPLSNVYTSKKKSNSNRLNYMSINSSERSNGEQIAYINFEEMPINPNYTYDINGMANLITNYQGVFSYLPSDTSFQFSVPQETINNSLQPLISEAKIYLNARGLSNSDIEDMLIEEGGQEVDLVPYATALAEYESTSNGLSSTNYQNLFFNSANARPSVLHCAAVALGIDALWALGGSNAASWTAGAMKKAFGAVAKRALGPIGVAIAVVSFGLCMGDWIP